MKVLCSALLAGLLSISCIARAEAQVGVTYSDLSTSLTTAVTNCLRPGNYKVVLMQNISSGNIGFCYRSVPGTACTPAIGTKGTFTLAAGVTYSWPLNNAPNNGLDCIHASSGDVSIVAGR